MATRIYMGRRITIGSIAGARRYFTDPAPGVKREINKPGAVTETLHEMREFIKQWESQG